MRAVERFLEEIESELLSAMRADGQTTASHSDAATGSNLFRDTRCGDLQLRAAIAGANPKHAADFLDKTGEHRSTFSRATSASKPGKVPATGREGKTW